MAMGIALEIVSITLQPVTAYKNGTHKIATGHIAGRYQQFWKIFQEILFPNMETIIFAQNSKQ